MRKNLSLLFLLLAVTVAALNLRTGIASLGPVLDDVLDAFGASGSLAGAITAMPGVFFGIMGLAAVPLATRIGLSRALFGGMLLTLLGLAVRPWVGDVAVFLVLTACVVGGIALGNVLLPAWIKSHGGRHAVVLMTLYSAGLGASGALGPLSAMWFSGEGAWKWALFIWVFLAVAQVLVWAFVVPRTGLDIPGAGPASATTEDAETARRLRETSLWRSPTARFLMLFFGLQAMNAYIQMGWLPKIYTDNGVSSSTASIGLSVIGALNIVGGLLMPGIIARVTDLRPFPAVFAALTGLGYVGLWLAPSTVPLLWAVLLGIGGCCFPTAIALIPARSRTPLVTARLSGFVQPLGYFIAGLGPFVLGVVHEQVGSWDGILIVLVCTAVLMGVLGVLAGKRTVIDDELMATHWRELEGH
ncbi:MAG: MFS transporter [Corynebacterium variabile]|uniref:MFS transporter n=1 Tax=Corynebacterium variabile TaxID=1727 RepID=UPI0026475E2A|nr:MFS transporter [Corynebacterium variabile]MDN6478369.1 MFS transporter [Corynebacterium variabile]MDN6536459.1 MFS transporter [Corynebacterium variabile]MDN6814890.1 MFS transporter [Corynebacterium variabile]